jgi:hypothetical protein
VTTDPSLPAPTNPPNGPLPARPPRSLLVHFGVDSAVAFLVLILPCLFFDVRWGIVALVALAIGAIACRFTRQAEVRALAARNASP